MVGITGVGGVPDPTPERPSNVRNKKKDEPQGAAGQDGVQISAEAQSAANLRHLLEIAKDEPDIRADRVREAREALDQEAFKLPGAIAEVARRLSPFID